MAVLDARLQQDQRAQENLVASEAAHAADAAATLDARPGVRDGAAVAELTDRLAVLEEEHDRQLHDSNRRLQAVARDLADERATHAESLRRLAAVRSQMQTLQDDLADQVAHTRAQGEESAAAVQALEAENTRLQSAATVTEKCVAFLVHSVLLCVLPASRCGIVGMRCAASSTMPHVHRRMHAPASCGPTRSPAPAPLVSWYTP
jgi:hypothetical protein